MRLPRSLRVLALAIALAAPSSFVAAQHGDEHGHDAAAHDAGGHETGHGHDASIDPVSLGGSVVNFVLLVGILAFMLRKPLADYLTARRAAVLEGIEEARRVKEAAKAKDAEYSARMANLDAEMEALREELRRGGLADRDRVVAEASKKAEKMREDARFLIDQQVKQLREDLTKEAVEAAVKAAEETLRKAITAHDQERLAQQYLGTLRTALVRKVEESRQ